ncbi:MAG: dioxygenase [Gammaproteobacteria bacterium]|nr:dioxygenase [Gammaproteobacteria bacterium]MCU0971365.1 dioxygenase [Gammaproteobacteria bacterium]
MLPAVFLSHGAPLVAIDGDPARRAWSALGNTLPQPRAVVVMTPHWLTHGPQVGAAAQHATLHDFGGMPRALYEIDYAPPGDPALAGAIAERLTAAGIACVPAERRQLDHGAWVPLHAMYPRADVPVVQVAVQPKLGPGHHYALGKALADLREAGVLVIGSGALTHNLREVRLDRREATVPSWVSDFTEWVVARLAAGDIERLLDYRALAPGADRNHPTEEHLLPLFFACGAAGAVPSVHRFYQGYAYGLLAMDVLVLGRGAAAVASAPHGDAGE